MAMCRKAPVWTAVVVLGWASCAFAQGLPLWQDSESSLRLRLEDRLRWEIREDADFRKAVEDQNDFLGQRLRAGFHLRLGPPLAIFAEGQDSRHFGADAEAAKIRWRYTDLRQAYLEVRNVGGLEGLSAKLGRQELVYGEERLVGAFGWSNVGPLVPRKDTEGEATPLARRPFGVPPRRLRPRCAREGHQPIRIPASGLFVLGENPGKGYAHRSGRLGGPLGCGARQCLGVVRRPCPPPRTSLTPSWAA